MDSRTETSAIERAFKNFTQERKDIGIVLINQHVCFRFSAPVPEGVGFVHNSWLHSRASIAEAPYSSAGGTPHTQIAERIRNSVDSFTEPFPAILEIPSKDHPYDPEKDSVLRRVRRLFGE